MSAETFVFLENTEKLGEFKLRYVSGHYMRQLNSRKAVFKEEGKWNMAVYPRKEFILTYTPGFTTGGQTFSSCQHLIFNVKLTEVKVTSHHNDEIVLETVISIFSLDFKNNSM